MYWFCECSIDAKIFLSLLRHSLPSLSLVHILYVSIPMVEYRLNLITISRRKKSPLSLSLGINRVICHQQNMVSWLVTLYILLSTRPSSSSSVEWVRNEWNASTKWSKKKEKKRRKFYEHERELSCCNNNSSIWLFPLVIANYEIHFID